MKKNVRMLTEAAVMIALAFVLSNIRLFQLPNGGSVTPGSMVPLILFAIRWTNARAVDEDNEKRPRMWHNVGICIIVERNTVKIAVDFIRRIFLQRVKYIRYISAFGLLRNNVFNTCISLLLFLDAFLGMSYRKAGNKKKQGYDYHNLFIHISSIHVVSIPIFPSPYPARIR
jgi:hypothetical protein